MGIINVYNFSNEGLTKTAKTEIEKEFNDLSGREHTVNDIEIKVTVDVTKRLYDQVLEVFNEFERKVSERGDTYIYYIPPKNAALNALLSARLENYNYIVTVIHMYNRNTYVEMI